VSGWSTPRPGRFTPGKDPVLIVQEAGWAPGPVWTDAENLALTGIRSPDRPARSESLYQLSYPGPLIPAIHKTYLSVPSTSTESKHSAEHTHTVRRVHFQCVHKHTRAQYLSIRGIQRKYVNTICTSDQGLRILTLPQGHYPMQGHLDTTT
jgi:hypothetical protein